MFPSHEILFSFPTSITTENPGCPGDHLSSISTHSIQFGNMKQASGLFLLLSGKATFLIQTDILVFFSFGLFTSQQRFTLMANTSQSRKTKSNKVTIMAFIKS